MDMETIDARTAPTDKVDELVYRALLVADQYADGLSVADRLDFFRWLGVCAIDKHNEALESAQREILFS